MSTCVTTVAPLPCPTTLGNGAARHVPVFAGEVAGVGGGGDGGGGDGRGGAGPGAGGLGVGGRGVGGHGRGRGSGDHWGHSVLDAKKRVVIGSVEKLAS